MTYFRPNPYTTPNSVFMLLVKRAGAIMLPRYLHNQQNRLNAQTAVDLFITKFEMNFTKCVTRVAYGACGCSGITA